MSLLYRYTTLGFLVIFVSYALFLGGIVSDERLGILNGCTLIAFLIIAVISITGHLKLPVFSSVGAFLPFLVYSLFRSNAHGILEASFYEQNLIFLLGASLLIGHFSSPGPNTWRILRFVLYLFCIIQASYTFLQWSGQSKVIFMSNGAISSDHAFGLSKHHSPLGSQTGLVILTLVFLFWHQLKQKSKHKLELAIIFMAWLVSCATLIWSGSRTGLVSLLLSLLTLVAIQGVKWLKKRSKTIKLTSLAIAVVTPFILFFCISQLTNELSLHRFSGQDSGNGISRLLMLEMGLEHWLRAPWLGQGAQSYRLFEDQYWIGPKHIIAFIRPHNEYIDILGCYGIIGFLLLLLLPLFLATISLKTLFSKTSPERERSKNTSISAYWLVTILVYVLTYSLADYSLRTPWVIIPIGLGIGYVTRHLRTSSPKCATLPKWATFGIILGFICCLLYCTTPNISNGFRSLYYGGHNDIFYKKVSWLPYKNQVFPNSLSLANEAKNKEGPEKLFLLKQAYEKNPHNYHRQHEYAKELLSQQHLLEAAPVFYSYLTRWHSRPKYYKAQVWFIYFLASSAELEFYKRNTESSYWLYQQSLKLYQANHRLKYDLQKLLKSKQQADIFIKQIKQKSHMMETIGVTAKQPDWCPYSIDNDFINRYFR